MKEYAVNHITSSPHYPQSNGLVEKFVQIVKNLFYKAKDGGTDIHKYLMIYCNMPLASMSKSSMQMLQQRSPRLQLPMSNAAKRQLGIALEQLSTNKIQHLPLHDYHIGQERYVSKSYNQEMVSCNYQSIMSRTKKLPNRNTRRDHIQENTEPPEAVQTSPKDSNK